MGIKMKKEQAEAEAEVPFNLDGIKRHVILPPPLPPKFGPAGLKFDQDKTTPELLPTDALLAIADVLRYGATKYTANNWRKGIVYSRLYGAMLRHLWSWWGGEDLDSETGKSHLAHLGCCVIFLLHFVLNPRVADLDDREENNK
jgi:hypothetical protein